VGRGSEKKDGGEEKRIAKKSPQTETGYKTLINQSEIIMGGKEIGHWSREKPREEQLVTLRRGKKRHI